jgi:hypothetical protein
MKYILSVVMLSDYELIKDAFDRQEFSGRPKLGPFILIAGEARRGIISTKLLFSGIFMITLSWSVFVMTATTYLRARGSGRSGLVRAASVCIKESPRLWVW